MKKLFFIGIICLGSLSFMQAQVADNVANKHFIEITGTSESEVTPDELYVTIKLMERMDGKEKVTIAKQEDDLKKNLKELGIDLANLTLTRADADYGKVRKSNKDVLIAKSYVLKISNADMLAKVYERLDKMDAQDAYVSRYTHSKILDFQKENRIKAVKAAKEKVDYLLAAVGQQAGGPLQIIETDNWVQDQPPVVYGRMASMNVAQRESEDTSGGSDISFKKIKIRSSFLVKYEIIAGSK